MNSNFRYEVFRPYGWVAATFWMLGVLGPEVLGISITTGYVLFACGFVPFFVGGYKGLRSK